MKYGLKQHVRTVRNSVDTLYVPSTEHDACGVGFIAQMHGKKSHAIIENGITILNNLTHRGAAGCDPCTGDGAGLLVQMPDDFFRQTLAEQGVTLPAAGSYGVGMFFMPDDDVEFAACQQIVNQEIAGENLEVLHWREVPNDPEAIGWQAREMLPRIWQVFVGGGGLDTLTLERRLFVAQSVIETRVANAELENADAFYPCSFSARTIVYKGLLLPEQVADFFADLRDERFVSSLAIVHSRYSTNTLPTWDLSHPFRYMAHNGEINTLRGNLNAMKAREHNLKSQYFSDAELAKLPPIIHEHGSDSACFDNALELLILGGRDVAEAMMMMVPEAWENDDYMDADRKAFYRYHAHAQEAWDGPAALAFTDGTNIGATLDRNGLRPARYVVTDDGFVIMASEVGVLPTPQEKIVEKGRLHPGRMFVIDTQEGRIVHDQEIKQRYSQAKPYSEWLANHEMSLSDLKADTTVSEFTGDELLAQQRAFGYSVEDTRQILAPMANDGKEPTASMGNDTPLAFLSKQSRNLYDYFKQMFAQVTNPPIDPIREKIVMSLISLEGPQGNVLEDEPEKCKRLRLDQPVLTEAQMEAIATININGLQGARVSTLYDVNEDLKLALESLCLEAESSVRDGTTMLVLSDRGIDANKVAIPSLLAAGAVHHHLIAQNLRQKTGLFVESGDAREVSHINLLVGYGVGGVCPYIALASLRDLVKDGVISGISADQAITNYTKAVGAGMLKIFSKMGISTLQSYKGAQLFEAIGLHTDVVSRAFIGTVSRIEGANFPELDQEVKMRHAHAFKDHLVDERLVEGGQLAWRLRGEHHMWNPDTVSLLQHSVRENSYAKFKQFSKASDDISTRACTIRGLMKLQDSSAIDINEVEPVEAIFKRFATGAMSFGSISREAHETLAIAMNRIGGKSNTGEGGEDSGRWQQDANGDLRRSAIKQVASGRFGVTTEYLVNADELQIKIAQGAKPGEGGQLPGHKVNQEIASTRHSTPGVGLISPPPHHDIYSIEDLAQLIYDLKNVNPESRVCVKLVAEVGVGTIAAGVSKGHSDVVLISGMDGGTGASPMSSIKHAGMPWELGLAETQQVLVQNDLRGRIIVQTDGQLKTGRDVVIAALLGAEEYGFATSALIVEGCIMMRKCHLNTCPVGIATQNPELRHRFAGDPAHVVNFFTFIAQEVREYMAELGFRTMDEMIGRVDLLRADDALEHWKAQGVDLSKILATPKKMNPDTAIRNVEAQDHGLDNILDQELIRKSAAAIDKKEKTVFDMDVSNVHRSVGTMLSGRIAKKHGGAGLPEDTLTINFKGSGGNSFGCFLAAGVTFNLTGDSSDYVGKGMSGGKIIIHPPATAKYKAEDNMAVGNTCLYGATGGKVYFRGRAGERFAVRNSGCDAVVEGMGDHGSEYMTGGSVICLGETGRNFAAGMSGGFGYIYDPEGKFPDRCNPEMVSILPLDVEADIAFVRGQIEQHLTYTGSTVAQAILDNWDAEVRKFHKVYPNDLRRVLEANNNDQAA